MDRNLASFATPVRFESRAFDIPVRAGGFRSAQRTSRVAANVLVRAIDADGFVGYGEASPARYVTGETQESVLASLSQENDALTALQNLPPDAPGADCALRSALHDVAAQRANLPMYRWLQEHFQLPTNESIRTRISDISLPILPASELAIRARDAVTDGFTIIKLKVGSEDMAADIESVFVVADAAPNVRLRLDGNQGFSGDGALGFLRELEPLYGRIEFFEQPTPRDDDSALRAVCADSSVPIFADEAAHLGRDGASLVRAIGCAGIVLKLAKKPIPAVIKDALGVYAAGGVCMMGCMLESRIGITAALHVVLALGTDVVPYLDLDGHLLVDDREFAVGGFTQVGGHLTIPPENRSGLDVKPLTWTH